MSERRRVFLTGSERAEFEHIYGPVPVDETDPRFALLTAEEEALVRSLPAGVPIRAQSQDKDSRDKIRAHEEKAGDFEAPEPSDKSAVEVEPVERGDLGEGSEDATGDGSPASPREPVGATKTTSKSSGNSTSSSKSSSK